MESLRRRLASYRFRRRLLWGSLVGVGAASAATVSIVFWNTAPPEPPRGDSGPASVFVAPTPANLSSAETRSALEVAKKFIRTAVRRERIAEAFELAGPNIRQGMTLEEWTTKDIAVVPYPVDFARWQIEYSFEDELGLQVYVFPDPGRELRPMTFLMSLRPVDAAKRRWVVDAWIPRGGAPASVRPNREGNRFDIGASIRELPHTKPRLGPEWLLLPFLLVAGTLVGIPAVLVVRERRRHARARREAEAWEARRYSESSSPS